MLKKVTACLMALFVLPILLYAQIADENGVASFGTSYLIEEILPDDYQIQHIQWKANNRARGYEIELQVQDSTGKWVAEGFWKTNEPEYDLKLTPGTYRFRISALNALGKKNGTSDWAEFDIFESTQPFLHRNNFPESTVYGMPVISRTINDENGKEILSVHALNCFDGTSRFSLIPVSSRYNPSSGARDDRKTISLPVTGSDKENHVVKLSLDWGLVSFGSYQLVVENSTKESDVLEVLVQPEKIPELTFVNTYYDSVVQADCLDVAKTDGLLSLDIKNSQFDTEYSLNPVEKSDNIYPFESGFIRETTILGSGFSKDGTYTVQLDTSNLKPGWYEFSAMTPNVGTAVKQVLIKAADIVSPLPEVTGISGKVNADTQVLAMTVNVNKALFSENQPELFKLYLISEKNELGENKRFQLRMTSAARNGKSAVFEMPASSLEPGVYACMLETTDGSRIAFIESDSKFKISLKDLTDEQIQEQFLAAPTEEILAAREAEHERLELAGLKYPEYLPAFNGGENPWSNGYSRNFPSSVVQTEDSVKLSVLNNVGERKFSSQFIVRDNTFAGQTIEMLRSSEGISFESMVTNQNNGRTKWNFSVQTSDAQYDIPLNSKLKKLSQTVVKWEDYGINPETIQNISFRVDVKDPHDPGWTNSLEVYEAKTYSSLEPVKELVVKEPYLFKRVGMYAGIFVDESISSDSTVSDDRLGETGAPSAVTVSVYDCDWLAFNVVYHPQGMGSDMMLGGELSIGIPSVRFKPYVGMGISHWTGKTWNELFAGIIIMNCLDIRYSSITKYTSNNGQPYNLTTNWIQAGLNVPIRKRSVHYVDSVTAKTPVFLTETTLGIELSSVRPDAFVPDPYDDYLLDYSFGVRLLGFKYFALDVSAAARGIPAVNPLDLKGVETRGEADLILPFKIFKQDFAIDYALGGGYWFGTYDKENHVFISESLGLKLGKNVKLKASFLIFDENWDDALNLASDEPLLAAFLSALTSSICSVGINLSVPLRTK